MPRGTLFASWANSRAARSRAGVELPSTANFRRSCGKLDGAIGKLRKVFGSSKTFLQRVIKAN